MYPLSQDDSLLLNIPTQISWVEICRSRVMLLQRPFAEPHLAILRYAHDLGVPVVLDFDDLLWELPEGHPATKHYGKANCDIATQCSREADAVICSTPELAQYVKNLGARHVEVIPNALPTYIKWNVPAQNKLIWWRGSNVHKHDIRTVEDRIVEVVKRYPDWKFRACGLDWDKFRDELGVQYEFQDLMQLQQYHNVMAVDSPAIMISPLKDLLFNRCKSNIGWMEASIAGAVALTPDFDNYALPGCVRYTDPEDFGVKLETLMIASPESRMEKVWQARAYIDDHYRIPQVNPERSALLHRVAAAGVTAG